MKLFITCQRFFPFAPVVCLVNFIFLSKGVTRHQHNVWNRSVKYLPWPQICFPYNVYSCLFLFPFFYFAQKMKMNHADSGSGGPSTKISIDNPILTFTPKKGNASQCRLLQGLPVFSGIWNYNNCLWMKGHTQDTQQRGHLKQISSCILSGNKVFAPFQTSREDARGDKCHPGIFPPGHMSYPGICLARAFVTRAYVTRATVYPG